jgi:hypothetical protein
MLLDVETRLQIVLSNGEGVGLAAFPKSFRLGPTVDGAGREQGNPFPPLLPTRP